MVGRTRVIGISGKARHGKDSVVDIARAILDGEGVRIAFADGVREEATNLHGWNGEKDEAGRSLLQRIGSVRREEDVDYWVRRAWAKISSVPAGSIVFIPDVRYENEAEAIRRAGGILWRVLRINPDFSDLDNGLTLTQKLHASETALDDYGKFDALLIAESLDILEWRVKRELERLGIGEDR
jgi:hypothetical protein